MPHTGWDEQCPADLHSQSGILVGFWLWSLCIFPAQVFWKSCEFIRVQTLTPPCSCILQVRMVKWIILFSSCHIIIPGHVHPLSFFSFHWFIFIPLLHSRPLPSSDHSAVFFCVSFCFYANIFSIISFLLQCAILTSNPNFRVLWWEGWWWVWSTVGRQTARVEEQVVLSEAREHRKGEQRGRRKGRTEKTYKGTQRSPCGGSICENLGHMFPRPGLGFQMVLWTQPVHGHLRDHPGEDAQGSALRRPGSSVASVEERWTQPQDGWVLKWEGMWEPFLGWEAPWGGNCYLTLSDACYNLSAICTSKMLCIPIQLRMDQ